MYQALSPESIPAGMRLPGRPAAGTDCGGPCRHNLLVVTDLLPGVPDTDPVRAGDPFIRSLFAGLATAVAAGRGAWVGGHQNPGPALTADGPHRCGVPLSPAELEEYSHGYSDATLWPVYHDAVERPLFHGRWEHAYRRVNQRFAEATATAAAPYARVWIHGHRLQLVPGLLRRLRPDLRIGLSLHTPFPPPELFVRLPGRSELLSGLLGADLIGTPRPGGARNLVRVAGQVLGLATGDDRVEVGSRMVRVQAFRTGIDTTQLARVAGLAQTTRNAARLRARLGCPDTVLLGIDRLDASQGTEQRLAAFAGLLAAGRLDPAQVRLVQVVLPDPHPTAARLALRGRIEQLVARVNGDHARVGWPVVHYLYRQPDLAERAALYRAADVMAVTALREGAGTVAKEYVTARPDGAGALVLSELTGSAADLPDAFLANPYDADALRSVLLAAATAPPGERADRLRRMRHAVHHHDIRCWTGDFLDRLGPAQAGTAGLANGAGTVRR